jgi:hypothetical protein
VCWAIEHLDLDVQVMPYSVHMHGCYPMPAGGDSGGMYVTGVATYNGEPVLFRHHL